jgi:hypothetical protein
MAMTMRVGLSGWMSVLLAATMVAACQPKPLVGPNIEKRVSSNAFGNVTINVDGRSFQLKTTDDKPVTKLAVQTAGKSYELVDGQLQLSAGVLSQAKSLGKGFFVLYAQGYSPKQVWIGQKEDVIYLSPVQPAFVMPALPRTGGTLEAPNGMSVTFPSGMMDKDKTNVALSGYTPSVGSKEQEDFQKQRSSLLAKLEATKKTGAGAGVIATGGGNVIAVGGGNYRINQAADCQGGDVIPCVLQPGIGMLVTVDGPINPGSMVISLDLGTMLRTWDGKTVPPPWSNAGGNAYHVAGATAPPTIDPDGIGQVINVPPGLAKKGFIPYVLTVPPPAGWPKLAQEQALGASNLLIAFNNIAAEYGLDGLNILQQDYGMTLDGTVLTFPVNITTDQIVDGIVRTSIAGTMALGVNVEVMIVSSTSPNLPAIASVPDLIALAPSNVLQAAGNLVSNNAGSLISNNSAGLIGNNGGTLISNNGSGLISNNGSGLIANNAGSLYGDIRTPFRGEQAKYELLSFSEYNWPASARYRAVDELGTPLTDWQSTTTGKYRIDSVPAVGGMVFVEVEADENRLRTLARGPGEGNSAQVDINTVTTAVTSYVRDRIAANVGVGVEDVNVAQGFTADTTILRERFDQTQANTAVTQSIPVVAAMTKATLGEPLSLNPPVLKRISMRVDEIPDHKDSARGLAIVTGLPESAFSKGKTTDVTKGYTFNFGLIKVDAQGFGNALKPPKKNNNNNNYMVFAAAQTNEQAPGEESEATSTGNSTPAATPAPTPTPEPPPSYPEGAVRLIYTVEVQRGSGAVAKYDFQFYVNNYMILDCGGNPLPLEANLLDPRRVQGALLGNFWTYMGQR